MKRTLKTTVVAVSAAALVLGLSGCSDQERAFFQAYCSAQPDTCKTLPTDNSSDTQRIEATAVPFNQGPATLQTWIRDRQMSDDADSAHVSDANVTYVTVAGGLRPTGGYRVEVSEAVRKDSGWVIEARVVAPEPGTMVTMAMTNPTVLVRFPSLEGEIQIRLEGAPGASNGHVMLKSPKLSGVVENADITAEITWMPGNILHVTGSVTIDVADLYFEVRAGTTVLAQSDAQVKEEGYYVTNLIVPDGATDRLTLLISTVEPDGGKVLLTRELSAE